MYSISYYVLAKDSEETIAICFNEDSARWILKNYPQECILRIAIVKK